MDDLDRKLAAAKRLHAIKSARDNFLPFMRLRMPDPEFPDDPEKSLYEITPQAKLLAEALEKVERGELLRLIVSIGPQLGKSEMISRGFPAWYSGRNPYKHLMLGTYNETFAQGFGSEVREIMNSKIFNLVFPQHTLRKGSKAKDELWTTKGGALHFLGRGGSGTGKRADVFIIDDPLKDDIEAQSATIREQLWSWFNKVALTRGHNLTAIVIVHTRWHEDDLIGRLVDPSHPSHDPEIAKHWTYINIPSVITDEKLADALDLKLEVPEDEGVIEMFGKVIQEEDGKTVREPVPMVSLWEGRKSLKFLAAAKRLDPKGFEALYQGNPAPEDGDYFKADYLKGYKPHEFPKNVRWYGASDHALSTKKRSDKTIMGCIGVDEDGVLWIPPDIVWGKYETDKWADEIVMLMRRKRPLLWWAAGDNIIKAVGPFLRKMQIKEKVYTRIEKVPEIVDITIRARAISGMMALGLVRFPTFAPWWQEAKNEILKFPNAAHDDFVAWLAILGLGIDLELPASRSKPKDDGPKVGTLAWVKAGDKENKKRNHLRLVNGGW